jgi:hypothetical protein
VKKSRNNRCYFYNLSYIAGKKSRGVGKISGCILLKNTFAKRRRDMGKKPELCKEDSVSSF